MANTVKSIISAGYHNHSVLFGGLITLKVQLAYVRLCRNVLVTSSKISALLVGSDRSSATF